VPYWSAHLPGALSEKVIISGHSVQETPQAVLEVRRILHRDIDDVGRHGNAGLWPSPSGIPACAEVAGQRPHYRIRRRYTRRAITAASTARPKVMARHSR
jgi:hypothetical protein